MSRADVLVSADSHLASQRERFARLTSREFDLNGLRDPYMAETSIHVLRIRGLISGDNRENLARLALSYDQGSLADARKRFLLVIRLARENDNKTLVEEIFSYESKEGRAPWKATLGVSQDQTLETLDIATASMSLTYREALDLGWALDVARRAIPHGHGRRPGD